jgi:hypothetical protein
MTLTNTYQSILYAFYASDSLYTSGELQQSIASIWRDLAGMNAVINMTRAL